MPLRTDPQPPISPAEASLADAETLRAAKDRLARMPARSRLHRLQPAQRQKLGVITRFQTRKSLLCLTLLRDHPELLDRMKGALDPDDLRQALRLRLSVQQCRAALQPVRLGLGRAELLLRAAVTEDCDAIEDHFARQAFAEGATAELRRRLRAKFDDPAGLRRLFEEGTEMRRARRARRKAERLDVRAESERARRRERALGRLKKGALPGMEDDR